MLIRLHHFISHYHNHILRYCPQSLVNQIYYHASHLLQLYLNFSFLKHLSSFLSFVLFFLSLTYQTFICHSCISIICIISLLFLFSLPLFFLEHLAFCFLSLCVVLLVAGGGVMSGETSPDIRRYSYLSSALVNYVIRIFLMEERKDEREKREHILVCFIVFFCFFLDKKKKEKNIKEKSSNTDIVSNNAKQFVLSPRKKSTCDSLRIISSSTA